jgi:hypothetical protein
MYRNERARLLPCYSVEDSHGALEPSRICSARPLLGHLIFPSGNDPPAPTAPAPRIATNLPAQCPLAHAALVFPLRDAGADADHAEQLAFDDAADALDLVALVAGAELGRWGALVGQNGSLERIAVVGGGRRRRRGRCRRRRGREVVGVAGILGVAVGLLLTLLGGTTIGLPAADDAPVAVADAGAEAAEDLAVVVAPAPDAAIDTAVSSGVPNEVAVY